MSSDTEKKSMEQHARDHRDSMVEAVRLFGLLQDADDSDDIEPDDWRRIVEEFEVDPDCDNCGQRFSDHRPEQRKLYPAPPTIIDLDGTPFDPEETILWCPDDIGESEPTTFELHDLSDLVDEAREHIDAWSCGAGISMTVDVILYGGGPAGGIEFDVEKGRFGLEMLSARVWHQDWFEPKGYAPLDDDTASRLFDAWGLEYMMEGE